MPLIDSAFIAIHRHDRSYRYRVTSETVRKRHVSEMGGVRTTALGRVLLPGGGFTWRDLRQVTRHPEMEFVLPYAQRPSLSDLVQGLWEVLPIVPEPPYGDHAAPLEPLREQLPLF